MKVLNLQCALGHSFEGWFASEVDFQAQLVRGLVECPLCADKVIQKMPSAPRLNLGSHQAASQPAEQGGQSNLPAAPVQSNAPEAAQAGASLADQSNFLKALRQVLANTEDVGGRFADEARRMHYGDIEARSIRGQTSVREAVELMEEGIEVMPLPMPAALKETLQ